MSADNSSGERGHLTGSTSQSLLAHARGDDRGSWSRLVRLYAPLVATWCRRHGVAQQDVADLLQEVFAAVASNLARFRKERPCDTFRGWLATIARNKVCDYHRRRAGEPAGAGGTEASLRMAQIADAGERLEDWSSRDERDADNGGAQSDEFSEVIQRALHLIRGEFHDQTWRAFWGVAVEGRAAADVAAELAMRPGAVRVAKSRVLARLRRELGDMED